VYIYKLSRHEKKRFSSPLMFELVRCLYGWRPLARRRIIQWNLANEERTTSCLLVNMLKSFRTSSAYATSTFCIVCVHKKTATVTYLD